VGAGLAGTALAAGIGLIGVARVSEGVAILEKRDHERQRRVFDQLTKP